jgi:circadian clock protein KaiC
LGAARGLAGSFERASGREAPRLGDVMRQEREPALMATGTPGLDDVLAGGLPRGRLFLLQGDPGSGKTTIGLSFLLEGVRLGETCLYVTLSETRDEVASVAAIHGWTLDGIDVCDISIIASQLDSAANNTVFNAAEVEFHEATEPLLDEITRLKPQRVVFDSVSELRMLATERFRYRRRLLALKQRLAAHGCTALLIDDRTQDPHHDMELQSLTHGVIELGQRAPLFGKERRYLRVLKLRGTGFIGGYHDLALGRGGARVFSRLIPATDSPANIDGAVSSGLEGFDALLGGGPHHGTSTLVVGPAGTGKSLLMQHYALAAAERGERAAIFSFEEGLAHALARANGVAVPIEEHIKSGLITFQQIDPAEMSPLEFAHVVHAAVESKGIKIAIIDSLNGYFTSMPDESFLSQQVHELLTYLSHRGVAAFLVMAHHGILGTGMATPIDISYIADNVVLLRYFETGGEVRKAISVVKKRTGYHEATIRELFIAKGGLKVGQPLNEFHGVLTGIPVYTGTSKQLLSPDDA